MRHFPDGVTGKSSVLSTHSRSQWWEWDLDPDGQCQGLPLSFVPARTPVLTHARLATVAVVVSAGSIYVPAAF